jgi:NADP-dependent 3-hydroxy acid dehydrogenase YdfG
VEHESGAASVPGTYVVCLDCGKEFPVQGDGANLSDLDRSYTIKKHNRQIDIIFANVGLAKLAPFGKVDEKSFDLHFDANVKGLFFSVQKVSR